MNTCETGQLTPARSSTGAVMSHEATVGVRRINASVPLNFLEEHRVDVVAGREQFIEPALETEETHAAPLKSLRLEVLRAAGDRAVQVLQSPPCVCAQIKGQDRRVHRRAPVQGRVTDATGS